MRKGIRSFIGVVKEKMGGDVNNGDVFCFKDVTWRLLLAPAEWGFVTYRWIERCLQALGLSDFRFQPFYVDLITTDLSSQFMTHITMAVYLGLLGASPLYII